MAVPSAIAIPRSDTPSSRPTRMMILRVRDLLAVQLRRAAASARCSRRAGRMPPRDRDRLPGVDDRGAVEPVRVEHRLGGDSVALGDRADRVARRRRCRCRGRRCGGGCAERCRRGDGAAASGGCRPRDGDRLPGVDDRRPAESVRASRASIDTPCFCGDRADRVATLHDDTRAGGRERAERSAPAAERRRAGGRGGEEENLAGVDDRRPRQPVDREDVGGAQSVTGGDRRDGVAGCDGVGVAAAASVDGRCGDARPSWTERVERREEGPRCGARPIGRFGGLRGRGAHQQRERAGEGDGHAGMARSAGRVASSGRVSGRKGFPLGGLSTPCHGSKFVSTGVIRVTDVD